MSRYFNWKILLLSILSLIFVFIISNIIRWFTMVFGAYMSDFGGEIIWNISVVTASSEQWVWNQVMWLYFAPYLALLFIISIIKWKRKYPSTIPQWLQLIQSWAYLLLLTYVLFMPLADVLTKQGIYHAFNWLGIERYLQIIIGILMLIFFIYESFNISTLFSTQLEVPDDKLITTKQILIQLPYIWYIPITLLTAVVYFTSNYTILPNFIYFLSGIAIAMIGNTWLISRYNVVVR